jgi:hypothetical protein
MTPADWFADPDANIAWGLLLLSLLALACTPSETLSRQLDALWRAWRA